MVQADGEIRPRGFERSLTSRIRVCAGRHVGEASVWVNIVSILAVYDIKKAKDPDGSEVPVQVGVTDALIR